MYFVSRILVFVLQQELTVLRWSTSKNFFLVSNAVRLVLICCYGSFHDLKNTLLIVIVAVVTKVECLLCLNFRNFECMMSREILAIETCNNFLLIT